MSLLAPQKAPTFFAAARRLRIAEESFGSFESTGIARTRPVVGSLNYSARKAAGGNNIGEYLTPRATRMEPQNNQNMSVRGSRRCGERARISIGLFGSRSSTLSGGCAYVRESIGQEPAGDMVSDSTQSSHHLRVTRYVFKPSSPPYEETRPRQYRRERR